MLENNAKTLENWAHHFVQHLSVKHWMFRAEHISGGDHFGDADTSIADYQLENLYGLTWIYFSWLYFLRHKNILGRLHCWEHRREYKKDQFRQKHTETILPLFLHSHKMLFYRQHWDVYALIRAWQTLVYQNLNRFARTDNDSEMSWMVWWSPWQKME